MPRQPLFAWAVALSITILVAAEARSENRDRRPAGTQVELFQAMKAGQVAVRLVPKDAKQATIIVRNRTANPLSIKMPAAFAGLPVLAQLNDVGGGRDRGGRRGGGGAANQGIGGGLGGGGLGGGLGGGGLGGGFFDIGPERVRKIKVPIVCLEHGKPDPNARVPYELRPIEALTQDAKVKELCTMLGRQEVDQVSAQAAAWHLTDGLSWDQLARKVRVKHRDGRVEMYFYPVHMQRALKAVAIATGRAADRPSETPVSPGELADAASDVSNGG